MIIKNYKKYDIKDSDARYTIVIKKKMKKKIQQHALDKSMLIKDIFHQALTSYFKNVKRRDENKRNN